MPAPAVPSARDLWVTGQPRYTEASKRLQASRFAPEIDPGLTAVQHRMQTEDRARERLEAEANLERVKRELEAEYDGVGAMKGPADFERVTGAELEQFVAALKQRVERWFADEHHSLRINIVASESDRKIPLTAWKELVRQANAAGWDASFQGSIVEVKRP
ncbi:MAG: hypothetical protein QM820_47190 [Minicystis sp.]